MSRVKLLKWASCLNLFMLLLVVSSLIENKSLSWLAVFIGVSYIIFCKDNRVMNEDSALLCMSVFYYAPRVLLVLVHAYILSIHGDKDSALMIIVFVILIQQILLSVLFGYLKISTGLGMFGLTASNAGIIVSKSKRRFLSSWVMYYVYITVSYVVAVFIRRVIVEVLGVGMALLKIEVLPNLSKYLLMFTGVQVLLKLGKLISSLYKSEVKRNADKYL